MTPPRSVEEEAEHIVRSVLAQLHGNSIAALEGELSHAEWTTAIATALLRLRQDTTRRAALVASAETQNSNHVRGLSAEAAYEQACGAITAAILADAGVGEGLEEAEGALERRGRIAGLREAADFISTIRRGATYLDEDGALCDELRRRAKALDQTPP